MSKLLVLPDIHGRKFWKNACNDIKAYDKVIFLGDYLDPYAFENITVSDAIENFKEIIDFKKENEDKVVLLLGNHDFPYYSEYYLSLSTYHCRHSNERHMEIRDLFEKNKDLFVLTYVYDNILFSHAGVHSCWLEQVVMCEKSDINEISNTLNGLVNNTGGILKLYQITENRGGYDRYGSCVWADVYDMIYDIQSKKVKNDKPIYGIKQVFGHTLQAFRGFNGDIEYGQPVIYDNFKMLDTANAYVLDTELFTHEKVED